jgi:hypothetical protein
MKRVVLAAGLTFGLTAHAYGIVIRHDVPDLSYRWVGLEPAFDGVAFLGSNVGSGTATLIAPQWMLTAAHVVDDPALTAITFEFDILIDDGIQTIFHPATQVFIHPGWTGDFGDGVDLALVKLATPVTHTAPAPLYTQPTVPLPFLGVGVGYGRTGTGLTGDGTFDGQKRGGFNAIDFFGSINPDDTVPYFFADFDNPPPGEDDEWEDFANFLGSDEPLSLEFSLGRGDSGGPLWHFDADTETASVIGVASFVINLYPEFGLGSYGDLSAWTPVTPYLDWINAVIPEPASGVVLAAVAVVLLRRRGPTP